MAKAQEEKPFSEIDTLATIGKALDRLERAQDSQEPEVRMTRTLNWILSRYAPAGYKFTQQELEQQ